MYITMVEAARRRQRLQKCEEDDVLQPWTVVALDEVVGSRRRREQSARCSATIEADQRPFFIVRDGESVTSGAAAGCDRLGAAVTAAQQAQTIDADDVGGI
jgi:hypothetical protein